MSGDSETFTTADVQSAIVQFLQYGEQEHKKSHHGYYSGNGWAARVLRAHLGALAAQGQTQPAVPSLAADIKALKAADEVKSKLAGPPLGFYLLGFADCRDAAVALAARPQAEPAPTPQAAERGTWNPEAAPAQAAPATNKESLTVGAAPAESDVLPSEALYAFAGWLTSRNEPITLGAVHWAAPAADAVQAFIASQGWQEPRPDYTSRLKDYPAAPAGQPAAPTRSQKLAAAGYTRRPSLWAMQAREALELIASPRRPDGTWNRDREACRQLAAEALGRYDDEGQAPAQSDAFLTQQRKGR